MGNCAKLKWNRKKLGLSQKEFAKQAGLNCATVNKLENDETAWLTVRRETEEKIYAMFEGVDAWGLKKEDVIEENKTVSVDEPKNEAVTFGEVTMIMMEQETKQYESKKEEPVHNGLNGHDRKILTLIEFAYEGLTESETHEDFVANINIIKRIIAKY